MPHIVFSMTGPRSVPLSGRLSHCLELLFLLLTRAWKMVRHHIALPVGNHSVSFLPLLTLDTTILLDSHSCVVIELSELVVIELFCKGLLFEIVIFRLALIQK